MKTLHNNPLFTDITPEEEVSVQGGNPLVFIALSAAARVGTKVAVQAVVNKFKDWFADPDNGIIFWDKKGTYADGFRAGAGIGNDRDVPGGDKYGIKHNGKWRSV